MIGARCLNTNLTQAIARYARVTDVDFTDARMHGIDLSMSDARANFTRAVLTKADLRGADLSGANFEEADLSGANLQDAKMLDANLNGARIEGAISALGHRFTARNSSKTTAPAVIADAGATGNSMMSELFRWMRSSTIYTQAIRVSRWTLAVQCNAVDA
jgi:hypothetical protein